MLTLGSLTTLGTLNVAIVDILAWAKGDAAAQETRGRETRNAPLQLAGRLRQLDARRQV
jgi:hypothetical protein